MSQLFPAKLPLILKIFLSSIVLKFFYTILMWWVSIFYIFSGGNTGSMALNEFMLGMFGGNIFEAGVDEYQLLGRVSAVMVIPILIDAFTIYSLLAKKYKSFLGALFIQIIIRLVSLISPLFIVVFLISLLSKSVKNYFKG